MGRIGLDALITRVTAGSPHNYN
ncbi:protein of unknown function [Candidatus Methylomirabilis oxygeniifera]|uniref:Uncharacterized protein n=1 Tax=Methylomirabilis oxygeniifera TaxID=671143 RepID=D5MGN8_METO1|nr:protein of unknown function [Candidatus Methylomirabilis oxyfera]